MEAKHFTYQETADRADVYSFHLSLMDGGVEIPMEAKFFPSGDIEMTGPVEMNLSEGFKSELIDRLAYQYFIETATQDRLDSFYNFLSMEGIYTFDNLFKSGAVRKALKKVKGQTNG